MTNALPGILELIAEAAGDRAALTLAREVGGTYFEFPKSPGPKTKLAKLVGVDAARKIVAAIGHGRQRVPFAHLNGQAARRAKAVELTNKGLSAREIVQICGIDDSTVRRARRRARSTEDMPLFDRDE